MTKRILLTVALILTFVMALTSCQLPILVQTGNNESSDKDEDEDDESSKYGDEQDSPELGHYFCEGLGFLFTVTVLEDEQIRIESSTEHIGWIYGCEVLCDYKVKKGKINVSVDEVYLNYGGNAEWKANMEEYWTDLFDEINGSKITFYEEAFIVDDNTFVKCDKSYGESGFMEGAWYSDDTIMYKNEEVSLKMVIDEDDAVKLYYISVEDGDVVRKLTGGSVESYEDSVYVEGIANWEIYIGHDAAGAYYNGNKERISFVRVSIIPE